MMQLVVAAALWGLAASCCLRYLAACSRQPLEHGRPDARMLFSSACAALALTLTADPIYASVDPVLASVTGVDNLTDLLKHTFLVLSVHFLSMRVLGAEKRLSHRKVTALRIALGTVLTTQTIAFTLIGAAPSTTSFMATFGREPATVAYSLSHFCYFGAILSYTGWVAASRFSTTRTFGYRAGLITLIVGCSASTIITIVIIIRDFARYVGAEALVAPMDATYKALLVLVALALSAGLAVPALLTEHHARRRQAETETLLLALDVVLHRIRPNEEWLTVGPQANADASARLHRVTVEIRDIQLLTAVELLSPEEEITLGRAEELLTGRLRGSVLT